MTPVQEFLKSYVEQHGPTKAHAMISLHAMVVYAAQGTKNPKEKEVLGVALGNIAEAMEISFADFKEFNDLAAQAARFGENPQDAADAFNEAVRRYGT